MDFELIWYELQGITIMEKIERAVDLKFSQLRETLRSRNSYSSIIHNSNVPISATATEIAYMSKLESLLSEALKQNNILKQVVESKNNEIEAQKQKIGYLASLIESRGLDMGEPKIKENQSTDIELESSLHSRKYTDISQYSQVLELRRGIKNLKGETRNLKRRVRKNREKNRRKGSDKFN